MSNKKCEAYVQRYFPADRIMHWTVALGFVMLFTTGLIIFFEGSASLLTGTFGRGLRLVHRIGAVLFVSAPLIYLIFSKNRFGWLCAFKWGRADLGWLKAAPKHYFIGGDGMPPQCKYNTGQKLYYFLAIILGGALVASGFTLWFDLFTGRIKFIMLIVHDISTLILVPFFFVHVYLTCFHPKERKSFEAMATGLMEQDYAEHHHKVWYDEVKKSNLVNVNDKRKINQLNPVGRLSNLIK